MSKRNCPECGAQFLRLHVPGCSRDLFAAEGIDGVDGSDIDRVTRELIAREGADAILGRFLRDKVCEVWAAADPVSCVADE